MLQCKTAQKKGLLFIFQILRSTPINSCSTGISCPNKSKVVGEIVGSRVKTHRVHVQFSNQTKNMPREQWQL